MVEPCATCGACPKPMPPNAPTLDFCSQNCAQNWAARCWDVDTTALGSGNLCNPGRHPVTATAVVRDAYGWLDARAHRRRTDGPHFG